MEKLAKYFEVTELGMAWVVREHTDVYPVEEPACRPRTKHLRKGKTRIVRKENRENCEQNKMSA